MENGGNADHLLDYVAGKLNGGARAQMAEHVESCAACRELAGGQQAVWQALEGWEPDAISMDFDRRLYRRIEEQVSWWAMVVRPFRVALVRRALPIAAAAALTITAGILIERTGAGPAPVAHPQTAHVELQPDQLQSALDDLETLQQFTHALHTESDSQM